MNQLTVIMASFGLLFLLLLVNSSAATCSTTLLQDTQGSLNVNAINRVMELEHVVCDQCECDPGLLCYQLVQEVTGVSGVVNDWYRGCACLHNSPLPSTGTNNR